MTAQIENGYTRIANEIVEAMCQLKCSNYESRFLWALFRKTYGFQKKEDFISLTQFADITGIPSQHIARTKTKLVEKQIIYAKGKKVGFNKALHNWVVPKQVVPNEVVPKQVAGSTQTGSQPVPKQVLTKETITKETIQKKYISIKDLTEFHFQEIAEKYNVPIAFVVSKYDDMLNWHESTGKTKKDWIATLRNFVKKDAVEIKMKDSNAKRFGKARGGIIID